MANARAVFPLKGSENGVVEIYGSFGTNGASGVPLNVLGVGFTVAYSTTGTYNVTLTDNWTVILGVQCDIQLNTAPTTGTSYSVQAGAQSLVAPTYGTQPNYSTQSNLLKFPIVIFNSVTGTPTDIASNANNRISFKVTVKNLTAAIH